MVMTVGLILGNAYYAMSPGREDDHCLHLVPALRMLHLPM